MVGVWHRAAEVDPSVVRMDRMRKLIVALAALCHAGCVAELTDGCLECRVTFHYTLSNPSGGPGSVSVSNYVRTIEVYVFDAATGVLTEVIDVPARDIARGYMDMPGLDDGTYVFVAWGSSHDDLGRSFSGRHMNDASTHEHEEIRVGETTLRTFYMMLGVDDTPEEMAGDIVPLTEDFDDLFWAVARDVVITKGKDRSPVDFNFIRNTSLLKVTVTGLEHLGGGSTRGSDLPLPEVYVLGRNGRYRWDNSIDDHARRVHYASSGEDFSSDTLRLDIKTMHLDIARHRGDDQVQLYLKDATTGRDIISPLDILGVILQTRNDSGGYLYPRQENIDRQYEFPIEFSVASDLRVHVYVSGWEVVVLEPEVEFIH